MCKGTGAVPKKLNNSIEGLDNLSPERLEAVRDIIRSEQENINDAMRRTQDSAERMSGGVRDNMQTLDEVNALLNGIQKSKEDRGHIHGPQCSHDGAPDHGGYSRITPQDELEQLHRMYERPEMPQEEVDAQYKGNPAWLDRSHLGSWNKRYTNENITTSSTVAWPDAMNSTLNGAYLMYDLAKDRLTDRFTRKQKPQLHQHGPNCSHEHVEHVHPMQPQRDRVSDYLESMYHRESPSYIDMAKAYPDVADWAKDEHGVYLGAKARTDEL